MVGMGGKSAVGTSPDKDKPQTDGLEKTPSQKDADFTSPIPLSNQTVITVNGKKCVLSYDAKTQQVCAYPIKTKSEYRFVNFKVLCGIRIGISENELSWTPDFFSID